MMNFPKMLERLMQELRVNQSGLAERLGVSQGTVSRWLRGGRVESENRDKIERLAADVLKTGRRRPAGAGVQIVGFAGAGDDGIIFGEGQGPFGEAKAPEWAGDKTVAVQIRGTSMGPLLDGWLAYYDDRRDPPDSSLSGKICVVGLTGGRVLLKKLIEGSRAGRWHLISNTQPPIFDAEVEWAAEVRGFEPPSSIIL